GRGQAPGDQHGATASFARKVQRVLEVLPVDSRTLAREDLTYAGEGCAVAGAAVRVLRRLLRLRRDALRQADDPDVWRSSADRQCYRVFIHLRRQLAHHALQRESRRPGPGVVEFAV